MNLILLGGISMAERRLFYLFGVVMFLIFSVRLFLMVAMDTFSLVETLSWGGMTYMCFAIGYLQPQIAQNDERAKYIKQKTMQYSLITILVFFLLISFITQTGILSLTSQEVLSILIAFSVFTIFTIWNIVAKRN